MRRSFKIQCGTQQFKFACEDNDERIDTLMLHAKSLRAGDPEGVATEIVLAQHDALIGKIRMQQSKEIPRLVRQVHKEARAQLAESALVASQLQSVVNAPESELRAVALQSLLIARRAVQSVDDLMVSQKLEWRSTAQQEAIRKWEQAASESSTELARDLQPLQVQQQGLIYLALLCGDVELVETLRAADPAADINQTMEIGIEHASATPSPTRAVSRRYHAPNSALGPSSSVAPSPPIASSLRPSALSVLACDTRLWDATPVLSLLSAGLDPTLPHPHMPHSSAIQVAREHLRSCAMHSDDAPRGEQKESDDRLRSRLPPPPPSHAVQTCAQARLVQMQQHHSFLLELVKQWTTHSRRVMVELCDSSMHEQEPIEVRATLGAIIAAYLDLQDCN